MCEGMRPYLLQFRCLLPLVLLSVCCSSSTTASDNSTTDNANVGSYEICKSDAELIPSDNGGWDEVCNSDQGLLQNHYSSLPPGDESEPLKQFRTVLVRRQFCQTDQTACSEASIYAQPSDARAWAPVPDRLMRVGIAFMDALHRDAALVIADSNTKAAASPAASGFEWVATNRAACPAQGHSCFFAPTASCATWPVDPPRKAMHLESSVSPIVLKHVADTHGIPPFDISAELALFLLQPNKQMREEVQRAKARVDWINLRRPILAVRVARLQRRQAVTSSEVSALVSTIHLAMERGSFQSVLLVSRSPHTSEALARELDGTFAVAHLNSPTCPAVTSVQESGGLEDTANVTEPFHTHGESCGPTSPCSRAVQLLLHLYLSAEADGFLGGFGMAFDRLVVRLAWATRNPEQRGRMLLWSHRSRWPRVLRDMVTSHLVPLARVPNTSSPVYAIQRPSLPRNPAGGEGDSTRLGVVSEEGPAAEKRGGSDISIAEQSGKPPPARVVHRADIGAGAERWESRCFEPVGGNTSFEKVFNQAGVIFPNFQVTNGEGRGLGTFYHICENTVSSDAPLNLGQCTEARMDDLMRTHYSYFAPGDFSPELVRFRQQLFHRQFCSAGADACNRATVYAYPLHSMTWTGLGARIVHGLIAFFDALNRDAAIVVADNRDPDPALNISSSKRNIQWRYTNPKTCPQRGHTCYLRETTSCAYWPHDSPRNVMYKERSIQPQVLQNATDKTTLSNFALTAEMMLFWMQPNHQLIKEIDVAKERLGWDTLPRPILAMHIRHGKLPTETKYFDFERFMRAALVAKNKYGFKSLFLFTDSKEVLERIVEYKHEFVIAAWDYPEFVMKAYDRSKDSFMRLLTGKANGCHEALPILIDMFLAVQTQGFLGVFTSNVDRIVARLSYAMKSEQERKDFPLWSLDHWPMTGMDIVTRERVFAGRVEHDGSDHIEELRASEMNASYPLKPFKRPPGPPRPPRLNMPPANLSSMST